MPDDGFIEQRFQVIFQLIQKFAPYANELLQQVPIRFAGPWDFIRYSPDRQVHEMLVNVDSPFVPKWKPSLEWPACELPGINISIITLAGKELCQRTAVDKKRAFCIVIERVRHRPLSVGSRSDKVDVVMNDVSDCVLRIVRHIASLTVQWVQFLLFTGASDLLNFLYRRIPEPEDLSGHTRRME